MGPQPGSDALLARENLRAGIPGDLRRSIGGGGGVLRGRPARKRRRGRDENGIFLRLRARHTPTRRDATLRSSRGGQVLIVSGGWSAGTGDDKIRRDEPATNYRGYWSVIDCFTATPRAFSRFARSVSRAARAITPARLFSACNLVIYSARAHAGEIIIFPRFPKRSNDRSHYNMYTLDIYRYY